ncbi:hypothetical protein SH668x_001850 [Planctomicrobium sp. SH668]|uniref:hypothetical protein n=1 Tax=Planctomicrobium sp. SH668 TaxID=3448126 RepID=UPI003F5CB92E
MSFVSRLNFLTAFSALLFCTPFLCPADGEAVATPGVRGELLLIVGTAGTDEYREIFENSAQNWIRAAEQGNFRVTGLGVGQKACDLNAVEESLRNYVDEKQLPLWIVMLGHGTFDGKNAKFNLPGPDLEPSRLAELVDPLERPVAIVNCSSASAPFLEALTGPNRVVITATNSGNEVNFARFGAFLSEVVLNRSGDLDKDDQVSLLEAFLLANHLTQKFYETDARLATEHALLDDNGDARPVTGKGFDGIHPIDRKDTGNLLADGVLAHQWHLIPNETDSRLPAEVIARRNELELQIAQLKLKKKKKEMPEDLYYAELEAIFLNLARLLESETQKEPDQSDVER